METGLCYDDVLLVPQYSDIRSRKEVDISTSLDKELKEQIEDLIVPPPYIGPVPAIKQDMQSLPLRIGKWIAFVRQAFAEAEELDDSGKVSGGKPRDFDDLKIKDRMGRGTVIPEWRKEEGAEHSAREPLHELDENEFDEQVKDFEYVDPYYAYELENEFNFPVRTFEVEPAKRLLDKWMMMTKRRGGMTQLEKVLHRKVLEIQLQAHKSTSDRKYFLPYTDWILSKYTPSELGEAMPEGGELDLSEEEARVIIELGKKLEGIMGAEEAGEDMPGEPEPMDMGDELMEALAGVKVQPSRKEVVEEVARRVARRLNEAKRAQRRLNRALGNK